MKGVQCYELFGGIALKIHTFSFSLLYVKQNDNYNTSIDSVNRSLNHALYVKQNDNYNNCVDSVYRILQYYYK